MNANKVRPLAAYGLVSLACAAVMVQGMQPTTLDRVIGAGPDPRATNASAPTGIVPGTVLRARPTPTATATPTGLPRIELPATGTTGGTVQVLQTSSQGASAGSGRPRAGSVTLHESDPPDRTSSAGSVDRPGAEQTTRPGKAKGHGKKPGKGHGRPKTQVGSPDRPGKGHDEIPQKGSVQDIRA